MVKKYVKALEGREINSRTGEIWTIYDVPNTWKAKVEQQIAADGYIILDDGTVAKPEPDPEPEPEPEENGEGEEE